MPLSRSPNTPLPVVELALTLHHGQSSDLRWRWPGSVVQADASTSAAQPDPGIGRRIGLDQVLCLLEGRNSLTPSPLRFTSLHYTGTTMQAIWWLTHSSHEMVCHINGKALGAGEQVRLNEGDFIEIGMTRLDVHWAHHKSSVLPSAASAANAADAATHEASKVGDAAGAPARAAVANPPPADSPRAEPAALADFELTHLSALAPAHNNAKNPRNPRDPSDISDLISMGEENLLGNAEAPGPSTLGAGTGKASAQVVVEPAEIDPLEELHALYLKTLRDPNAVNEVSIWQGIAASSEVGAADPIEELRAEVNRESDLNPILRQINTIGEVIDSLDHLAERDIAEPDPFDSIMHLFAPEHLKPPSTDDSIQDLIARTPSKLPSLTRREHHQLSIDSAMPLLFAQTEPAAPAAPSHPNKPAST